MNKAAAMLKKIAAKLTWTAGAAPVLLAVAEAEAVPDVPGTVLVLRVTDDDETSRDGIDLP